MADERLRLTAEVTDGFSGPLGKLEGALNRAARTGSQAGKDLKKDFEGFHGVLGKTTSALQGMTGPLSALGAAGLGAGLSLTAIGSALRSFSSGTQQLSILSKETGLTVDQLRAFTALGDRFGVSADTMKGGVMRFSEEMSRLRKRYGETYSSLQAMNLGDLVEKLVAAPNMKAAFDGAMDAISNIGDPTKARKVAEMLLGSSEFSAIAREFPGRVSEVLAEIEKRQGRTTDAQIKAAKRFEQTLSELRENIDGLRNESLTPLLNELNRLIAMFNTPDAAKAFKAEIEEIGKFARTTAQEFQAIVKVWGQIKDFFGQGDKSLNREFRPGLDGGRLLDPTVQPQNFGGGGFGGATIQRAGYGGGGRRGPLSTMEGGAGSVLRSGSGGSRMSPKARTGPLSGSGNQGPLTSKYPDGLAAGIRQSAKDLGISAEDLATVISYETGGTFDKWKRGPTTKWGTHRGLIQWGEPQARKYGVTADMSAGEQMKAVTQYLRDRGVKPGMGIHQVYGAINAGGVSESHLQMRDAAAGGAPGTVRDKVDYQMGPHRRKGVALLGAGASDVADAAPAMAGAGDRAGDRMMRRFYGDEAPVARGSMGGGKGSLHIQFENAPTGMRPRASMDDLFKDVTVSKSRQVEMTSL